METCELISKADIKEIEDNCHFNEKQKGGPKREKEDVLDDDEDGVQEIQSNDGGTLGKNLESGLAGVADGGPYSTAKELEPFLKEQKANDSERGRRTRLRLKSYKDLQAGDFPLTVAAHHLIPGNASLYATDAKLLPYLEDGGKVKTTNKKRNVTIEGHIGYDVNGSHNGVWLPGNYAIHKQRKERIVKGRRIPARADTSPKPGWSWSALGRGGYEEWQFSYVAGACKAGHGQFHDSHASPYSETVTGEILKISTALNVHLDGECKKCTGAKVPPPFRIKLKLYAISQRLRDFVMGPPDAWKKPWFTSQRWSREFFDGARVTDKFLDAYGEAKETRPGEPRDEDE